MGRVLSLARADSPLRGGAGGASVNDGFAGNCLAVGGFEVAARHVAARTSRGADQVAGGERVPAEEPVGDGEVLVVTWPPRRRAPARRGRTRSRATPSVFATEAGQATPSWRKRAEPWPSSASWRGRWQWAGQASRSGDGGCVPDESGLERDRAVGEGGGDCRRTRRRRCCGWRGTGATPGGAGRGFRLAANKSFAMEARVKAPPELPRRMTPILCSMDIKQYCYRPARGRADLYLPRQQVTSPNCQRAGRRAA